MQQNNIARGDVPNSKVFHAFTMRTTPDRMMSIHARRTILIVDFKINLTCTHARAVSSTTDDYNATLPAARACVQGGHHVLLVFVYGVSRTHKNVYSWPELSSKVRQLAQSVRVILPDRGTPEKCARSGLFAFFLLITRN